MKLHSAERTRSLRKLAGSRRNKKHRFVGTIASDSHNRRGMLVDEYLKPDHKARAVDISVFTASWQGVTQQAAAQHPDRTALPRITAATTRFIREKLSGG